MDRSLEQMLRPSPRIVRAWQCTALLLFCVTQQGCLCGCAHQTRQPIARHAATAEEMSSLPKVVRKDTVSPNLRMESEL